MSTSIFCIGGWIGLARIEEILAGAVVEECGVTLVRAEAGMDKIFAGAGEEEVEEIFAERIDEIFARVGKRRVVRFLLELRREG
jgi:hypothetical protein